MSQESLPVGMAEPGDAWITLTARPATALRAATERFQQNAAVVFDAQTGPQTPFGRLLRDVGGDARAAFWPVLGPMRMARGGLLYRRNDADVRGELWFDVNSWIRYDMSIDDAGREQPREISEHQIFHADSIGLLVRELLQIAEVTTQVANEVEGLPRPNHWELSVSIWNVSDRFGTTQRPLQDPQLVTSEPYPADRNDYEPQPLVVEAAEIAAAPWDVTTRLIGDFFEQLGRVPEPLSAPMRPPR